MTRLLLWLFDDDGAAALWLLLVLAVKGWHRRRERDRFSHTPLCPETHNDLS